MDKLRATLLVSMGILASGSGMIQVSAADYVFFTDFNTKQVSDFDDYTPVFLETTADLDNSISYTFNTFYQMNSCLPAVAQNITLSVRYRLNNTGSTFTYNEVLPDMTCQAGPTYYQIVRYFSIPAEHLAFIISDDAQFIAFQPQLVFESAPLTPGRLITLTDPEFVFTVNYDFNTTYLFNYFLSDSLFHSLYSEATSTTGTWKQEIDYVMTTAGNDRYFIINNSAVNYPIGTRTKFAIDYLDEYFRGESIGARYKSVLEGSTTFTMVSVGSRRFYPFYYYYYLNASNKQQDIVGVPEFEYEYEDCGWNAFDIPCFVNNAIAYVVNDAPVVSDAFTLLNAGMKLGGQAFAIIGTFTDNNLFGVLVLGGLGITAVRWFLKQD